MFIYSARSVLKFGAREPHVSVGQKGEKMDEFFLTVVLKNDDDKKGKKRGFTRSKKVVRDL